MGHGYSPAPPWPPGGLLDDVRSCCKVPQDFIFFPSSSAPLFFSLQLDTFSLSVYLSACALYCGHPLPPPPASSVCLDDFLQDAGTQTFLTRRTRTRATFLHNFLFFLTLLIQSRRRLLRIPCVQFGLILDFYIGESFMYSP